MVRATCCEREEGNGVPLMGMNGTPLNMAADVDYKRRQPHRSESPDIARIVSQSSKAKATTHGTATDCSFGHDFGSREFLTYLTLFSVLHSVSNIDLGSSLAGLARPL